MEQRHPKSWFQIIIFQRMPSTNTPPELMQQVVVAFGWKRNRCGCTRGIKTVGRCPQCALLFCRLGDGAQRCGYIGWLLNISRAGVSAAASRGELMIWEEQKLRIYCAKLDKLTSTLSPGPQSGADNRAGKLPGPSAVSLSLRRLLLGGRVKIHRYFSSRRLRRASLTSACCG